MNLLEVLRDAGDEQAGLALFRATTAKDTRRLAWLLAVGLDLAESEVAGLLTRLWEGIDAERAITDLASSPLVDIGGDSLRIVDSARRTLVDDFFSSEREVALKAHVLLAELEQVKQAHHDPPDGPCGAPGDDAQAESGSEDAWFASVRRAYYLAAVAPSDSSRDFIDLFANPPRADPEGARQWLTSLVLRQERCLDAQSRELSFFRAFETFTRAYPADALDTLRQIGVAGPEDACTALSLYQAGVIEGTSSNAEAVTRALTNLTRCIRLSEQLQLLENEIRARRSYCDTIIHLINVDAGSDSNESRRMIEEALRLASENQLRADKYGSDVLAARNLWTTARVRWTRLAFQDITDADIEAEAERIVVMLAQARTALARQYDVQAVMLTSRDAAATFAALARFGEAGDELEIGFTATQWGDAPAALLRLEDEARRLRKEAGTTHQGRLDDLLARMATLTSVFQ